MEPMMAVEPNSDKDASIGDLVGRLSAQTARLVRDELKLARAEFAVSAKHAGAGAGLLSVAGVLGVLGLAALVAAAISALWLVLPLWAAALVVASALLVAAGIAALVSKKQVERSSPVPQQTLASVKDDVAELKKVRS